MRLYYLESRIRRLESAVFERKFSLALDSGETISGMDFSRLVRGCSQAIAGANTWEAHLARHSVSAADEYGQKALELLRAVTHPVAT
jgi:hypothetical protein